MEGIKSVSLISGFSWADEVEKQEEEAKAQLNQQQKPNPFGSARPREVVLQEKGVDWRKLDQKLYESSNISYVYRKEKENIAAPTELTYRDHHPFPPSNNVLFVENPSNGCDRNGVPLVSQTLQNQKYGVLVPPSKYPPKNAMGLITEQTQYRSYNSYGSEFLRSNFHDFNTNNSIRENCRRHFTGWELMHHQSAHKERELHNMHSNERGTLYQERLVVPPPFVNVNEREGNSRNEFGRRNSVMERLGPLPIEAALTPNNGGGMKSSITVKEVGRREMEPEYGNRRFAHNNVDVEMVDFGGNCRKRAMISGFNNNSQSQQRRRR